MGWTNNMSRHALQRSQQRGIPLQMIEAVLESHDLDFEVGDDCRVLRVSRAAAAAISTKRTGRQVTEKLAGLAVIWSDRTNQVVTVVHDKGQRSARRYRGRV